MVIGLLPSTEGRGIGSCLVHVCRRDNASPLSMTTLRKSVGSWGLRLFFVQQRYVKSKTSSVILVCSDVLLALPGGLIGIARHGIVLDQRNDLSLSSYPRLSRSSCL